MLAKKTNEQMKVVPGRNGHVKDTAPTIHTPSTSRGVPRGGQIPRQHITKILVDTEKSTVALPLRARQTRRGAIRRCREPPAQEGTANCRTCEPMETAPFPGDDTRAGGSPVRVHESTDHGCGQTCRGMEGLVRRQVPTQRTRADVNVRPRPL